MKKTLKIPVFLFLFCSITSCLENVDFDQINELNFRPVIKTTLVYFTVNQTDFLDNTTEIGSVADISPFTFLKSTFVQDNLLKAELEFQIVNNFNRTFTVNIEFLDDNDDVTHGFKEFEINANQQHFNQIETIIIATNQMFLSSTKVKIIVGLSPSTNGSVLDPDNPQTLEFNSAGTYYLNI